MRVRLVGTVAAIGLFLAGCGGAQAGDPTPTGPSTTKSPVSNSTSSSGGFHTPLNVPKVTDPIDTTSWEREPCSVLTEAQLEELSITTAPKPEQDGTAGPECRWGDLFDDGITISGSFATKIKSTIVGLYRNNNLGRYAYFEPVTILGYPGALADLADGRDAGGCGIYIALRNDYIYTMSVRLEGDYPGYSEPCSVLKKISKMAIRTMTQGSS